MFLNFPEREVQVWIVFLGTGTDQETLTIAAITGSREEAEAMLEQGVQALPDRSNEWGSYRFTPCSESASVGRSPAIAQGERRRVHVLLGEDDWIEVFECREDADREKQEAFLRGRLEVQLIEIVTNTWVGIVGDDPRLRRNP